MPLKYTKWNDVELEHLNPQLDRQMITGENLMIARVLLKKGVIVPEHSHENEQLTYILEGALKFWIDGREIVVHAGEVFLLNESGSTKLGDAVYREVKTWNRWQVVTDRGKADLLLVVTQRESVEGVVATSSATVTGQTATATSVGVPVKSQSWFLHVVDAKSGDRLWTSNAAMGGKLWRTWNSIAKSLVGDIQKRM